MAYINNGEHDNPHELPSEILEGSLNTENTVYTHTNFGTKLPEEIEKLDYICDAAQVWGGPRATEHTKECLLPRRLGC